MTAIICDGTLMQVNFCHRRVQSIVSQAFLISMKHMKSDTSVFHSTSCSLRTAKVMSVVRAIRSKPALLLR